MDQLNQPRFRACTETGLFAETAGTNLALPITCMHGKGEGA